jgi:hypothetical protein
MKVLRRWWCFLFGHKIYMPTAGVEACDKCGECHVVHRTNREKEPQLHSHVLVMNTTLTKQKSFKTRQRPERM